MKKNIFGEMNFWCFLLGHKFCSYSSEKTTVCMRCELNNEKFRKKLILVDVNGKREYQLEKAHNTTSVQGDGK